MKPRASGSPIRLVDKSLDGVAQAIGAVPLRGDLELDAEQIERRWRDRSRGTAVAWTAALQRLFADQHVIGRDGALLPVDAEARRGIALRIEIDDQHTLADGGRARCRD